MSRLLFLLLAVFLLLSTSVFSFDFFSPKPYVMVAGLKDSYVANSTYMIAVSLHNMKDIFGKDAYGGQLEIKLHNASLLDAFSLKHGDDYDFDSINMTNESCLLKTALSIEQATAVSAILVFMPMENTSLEITGTLFGNVNHDYNANLTLNVSSLFANKTSYIMAILGENIKFIEDWISAWHYRTNRDWNALLASSVLNTHLISSALVGEMALSYNPGMMSIFTSMKDSFSNSVPVIGTPFSLMLMEVDKLLYSFISSIETWTPDTVYTESKVSELLYWMNMERSGWLSLNYTQIISSISYEQAVIKSTLPSIDNEIRYFSASGKYDIVAMFSILGDFIGKVSGINSEKLHDSDLLINITPLNNTGYLDIKPIFNQSNAYYIQGLNVTIVNTGRQNITTGAMKLSCGPYCWNPCVPIYSNSIMRARLFNNGIVSTSSSDFYTSNNIVKKPDFFDYCGLKVNYYYYLKNNTNTSIVVNLSPVYIKDNATVDVDFVSYDGLHLYSNLSIVHLAARTIPGEFSSLLSGSIDLCSARKVRLFLRNNLTSLEHVFSKNNFSITIAKASYQLLLQPEACLKRNYYLDLSSNATINFTGLICSDVNNDNKIGIGDIETMVSAFNSRRTHASYRELYDINCDGVINIFDLAIMGKNFYTKGAEFSNVSISMMQLHGTNALDEFIKLAGHANLTNYKLKDIANHVFTFPDFILNGSVRVHTGLGTNNATDVFWQRSSAVWNNDGDAAFLLDGSGALIDRQQCFEQVCVFE
ncbi:MAG: lamin tail domain-containing protein [Candidatus Aenigmatarchaeota archaeon]